MALIHDITDNTNGNLLITGSNKVALGYELLGAVIYNNNAVPCKYVRAKALVSIPAGRLVYLDINNNASLEPLNAVAVAVSVINVPLGYIGCFLKTGVAEVVGTGNVGESVYVLGNELSNIVSEYVLLGAVFVGNNIIKVEL